MRSAVTLPKAHLHIHLDGAARPETMAELAGRAGLTGTSFGTCTDWPSFLGEMVAGFLAISTLEDLTRICREFVEDEAAQGCLYTEAIIAPLVWAKLGSPDEVFASIREATFGAAEELGVEVRFQVAALRDLPPEVAEDSARFAAEHAGDGIVAFGLAGSEAPFPPQPFARAFAVAREAGLLSVPHAGEMAGADSVEAAIDLLGADRIAHGVRAVEDPAVLRRLADEKITCDVCPTSNVRLGVAADIGSHPIARMLAAGVPVTINADDPLQFGSGAGNEYEIVRRTFGLSDDDLAAIARTSVHASGATAETKARMLAGIEAWLALQPAEVG
ncbi:MAG: adenosine deaminase [Actinomycetota bacterium]